MALQSVPVRHRLPNPAPHFIGRARELEWLEAALQRRPVAVVCGPSGIGKTALVLHALHRAADAVPRTLFFSVRPGNLTAQLRLELVQALKKVAGDTKDLSALAGDPEALVEAAIDLAEKHELRVVLDDADHADAEEMNELLVQLTAYARKSRFFVTQRNAPAGDELRAISLTLPAMPGPDLEALARALAPDRGPAELSHLSAAAAGSPWLLQQLALGASAAEDGRDHLLRGVPKAVDGFLAALAMLRVPAPVELFERLGALPEPGVLDELERRGIVSRTADALRLHDMAAGVLSRTEPAVDRSALAAALSESAEAPLVVEGVRLWLEAGELEPAVRLLDRRAHDVFASGQAPRLFSVIGALRDKRLAAHQLKAAAEMGNPTALVSVQRPGAPEDELAWCEVLYAAGDLARARLAADAQRKGAAATSNRPRFFAASLLYARCLMHALELEAALNELAALKPNDDAERLAVRALSVHVAALARRDGAEAEALELARSTRGGEPVEVLDDLAAALASVGQSGPAREMIDRVLSSPRGARTSLGAARRALALRAQLELDAGELAYAKASCDALRPYLRSATLLRPRVLAIDAARRVVAGELAGIEADLALIVRDAGAADVVPAEQAAALRETVALLRGEPLDPGGTAATALRARRELRATGTSARVTAGSAIDRALLDAEAAALAGEAAAGIELATKAHQLAAGSPLIEAATLACLLDVATIAGRDALRHDTARALAALAQKMGSARYRAEAEVIAGPTAAESLEQIAAAADASPIAARRAAALLGGPEGDALDRAVVAALGRAEPGFKPTLLLSGDAPFPGWGLDFRTRSVWLPGKRVELESRALLFQVLELLVNNGGAASKETLVVGVWNEREYHPGRHDPRLHMTVRKVREAIETSASEPVRLVTTADGYALSGPLRLVR